MRGVGRTLRIPDMLLAQTFLSSSRRAPTTTIALITLASLVGCASTHETTLLIDQSRDAHVLVTGSNPVVELRADPTTNVEVAWQLSSMPAENQALGGYVARTMRGGGAFVLTSDQPASVCVKCRGATGFGVTQPAKATPRTQQ